MRRVSLSTLRDDIRTRYDLPAFSSTSFITTTAVNTMINKSLQAFYALLMQCYGDNYFATSDTLTTTTGVALTSLPTDFAKLIALHWVRSTNDVVQIRPGRVDEIRRYGVGSARWTEYTPRYRLSGSSAIEWFPTPGDAYDVRIDYVAIPADLSLDADTFDAGPGWEEWVVLDVCRKIATNEQSPDVNLYLAERNDWEARIRAQAPERDEGESVRIKDVYDWGGMGDHELRNRLTFGDY